jgi:hypothetical protein
MTAIWPNGETTLFQGTDALQWSYINSGKEDCLCGSFDLYIGTEQDRIQSDYIKKYSVPCAMMTDPPEASLYVSYQPVGLPGNTAADKWYYWKPMMSPDGTQKISSTF